MFTKEAEHPQRAAAATGATAPPAAALETSRTPSGPGPCPVCGRPRPPQAGRQPLTCHRPSCRGYVSRRGHQIGRWRRVARQWERIAAQDAALKEVARVYRDYAIEIARLPVSAFRRYRVWPGPRFND